jgi:hypothetical protein
MRPVTETPGAAGKPREVLAAEAFAMPAPDPTLHPRRVVLPDDPTGIAEPHDVLAAEEFPMPVAPPRTGLTGLAQGRGSARGVAVCAALGLLLLAWVLRRR